MTTCNHSESCDECRHRLVAIILERDRWMTIAKQRVGMRRELEELLEVGDTYDNDQFRLGLERLRELKKGAK